jgi:hypothetical protein
LNMNTNLNSTSTEAAQVKSVHHILNLCRKAVAQIEKAKRTIVSEFRDRLEEHDHLLELAVNEAEALAWQTQYPHLLFPVLATEKAQAVANWHRRQWFFRRTNRRPTWAD